VVWSSNDDRKPLTDLYNEFAGIDKKTPVADRITLIDDMSAGELKYVIGKCEAFVGARTHSTIAAYSQAVPTLVLGYSVKSRGIARDLFGTEENYVIPVQALKEKRDLLDKFQWIMENSDSVKGTLQNKMPDIKERAKGNVSFLDEV
jgi:polysaccharide pyruvyl transferase WcaK-like protein